jgi:hypothetical protein
VVAVSVSHGSRIFALGDPVGGPFEISGITVGAARNGKLTRIESFDADRFEEAIRRCVELEAQD